MHSGKIAVPPGGGGLSIMLLGAKMKFCVLKRTKLAFNMSDSETNLLKFELGTSNDLLGGLLYLPLVSGDNNFMCRSLARQMPW
jgi:hypothetical protein